ncbi:YaaA family protein [uncultured Ilyobacter sp.]|uniref:YaaA family protein n=1 Tax=uncultured Ilyobacter sp. TaxID=544433 RepID=UPI002AA73602|nr:YaaA family protein [uncultured Ilyobacter sp.]
MILVISPSKTMDFDSETLENSESVYLNEKTKNILKILKTFSKDELSKTMKLKGNLLDKTYLNIQNFETNFSKKAISAYTGTVFKEIKSENYSKDQLNFLDGHLVILSAFYGILSPFDLISPYRLDPTMKIFKELSLYGYWKDFITEKLGQIFQNKDEEFLINLASSEYIKMIDKKIFKHIVIDVEFKEFRNNKYSSISTYAKKARGMMTDYIIRKKCKLPEEMKHFDKDGYSFNKELSSETKYVFTR